MESTLPTTVSASKPPPPPPGSSAAVGKRLQATCTATATAAVSMAACAQGCGSRIPSCIARIRTAIIMTQSMGAKASARCSPSTTEAAHLLAAPRATRPAMRHRWTPKYSTVNNMTQRMAVEIAGGDAAACEAAASLREAAACASGHTALMGRASMAKTLATMRVVPRYTVAKRSTQPADRQAPTDPRVLRTPATAPGLAGASPGTLHPDSVSMPKTVQETMAVVVAYIATRAHHSGCRRSCTARRLMPTRRTHSIRGNCKSTESSSASDFTRP
mmetsp:Transcript_41649/g.129593  ORF Transcript_41649/g.129593 Transcript_41649/m.129593 type:complete len:274 (-) Transcript_41649:760-1581(-)